MTLKSDENGSRTERTACPQYASSPDKRTIFPTVTIGSDSGTSVCKSEPINHDGNMKGGPVVQQLGFRRTGPWAHKWYVHFDISSFVRTTEHVLSTALPPCCPCRTHSFDVYCLLSTGDDGGAIMGVKNAFMVHDHHRCGDSSPVIRLGMLAL